MDCCISHCLSAIVIFILVWSNWRSHRPLRRLTSVCLRSVLPASPNDQQQRDTKQTAKKEKAQRRHNKAAINHKLKT